MTCALPDVQLGFAMPVAGLTPAPLHHANRLLAAWGHYLGPVNRPSGAQAWVLDVAGDPVSVAVSNCIVSKYVTVSGPGEPREDLGRDQVVELGRLCTAPGAYWATRPMLRLWREIALPRWPYWTAAAAVAYSQDGRHDGTIYRFDGWKRAAGRRGSGGGGTWGTPQRGGDLRAGAKTMWVWRPAAKTPGSRPAAGPTKGTPLP